MCIPIVLSNPNPNSRITSLSYQYQLVNIRMVRTYKRCGAVVLWQGLCAAVQPAGGGAQPEGDEQEPHPGNPAATRSVRVPVSMSWTSRSITPLVCGIPC